MRARYAYFYFMIQDSDRVRALVPEHTAHWHDLDLDDYLGGPFEDRTGGLITFSADDAGRAEQAVNDDPFVRHGLLERFWLKRWQPL